MHVEFDGESGVENHLHGGVEVAVVFGGAVGLAGGVHHGLGIDAETNVIESGGLDESDVGGGGPGLEVFLGVSLGVVDLREPFAEIDAVTDVGEARRGDGGGCGLSERERREKYG